MELRPMGNGVYAAPHARIIDRSGRRRMPIGRDGFLSAMRVGTLIDKTMHIADVLDAGYAATLFCRPRRFGKTLNMTMMRDLEAPDAGGISPEEAQAAFEHTQVWEADGGARELDKLHRALVSGDGEGLRESSLEQAILRTSSFDLTSELHCHMLVMGLLFGVPGYEYPTSNREAGYDRYDIRLEPDPSVRPRPGVLASRPLVTVEVKYSRGADDAALARLAEVALGQIRDRAYDTDLPAGAIGRLCWGVAFSGKHVAVACERA